MSDGVSSCRKAYVTLVRFTRHPLHASVILLR